MEHYSKIFFYSNFHIASFDIGGGGGGGGGELQRRKLVKINMIFLILCSIIKSDFVCQHTELRELVFTHSHKYY